MMTRAEIERRLAIIGQQLQEHYRDPEGAVLWREWRALAEQWARPWLFPETYNGKE